MKIDTKTKVWRNKETKEKVEVLTKNLFDFINRQTKLYEDFKSLNLDYKKVYYEDLCKNFDETINSIQDYLNVERFELDPAMLQKQEKRPLREVIKNYEEVKLYDGFYKIWIYIRLWPSRLDSRQETCRNNIRIFNLFIKRTLTFLFLLILYL